MFYQSHWPLEDREQVRHKGFQFLMLWTQQIPEELTTMTDDDTIF